MADFPTTLTLLPTSRYRHTPVFLAADSSTVFFGTWRPPEIVETLPPTIHRVKAHEVWRPDLIAYAVYKNPSFFWAIAIRNNIMLPLVDITPGQELICPHAQDVLAALSTSSPTSSSRF